MGQIRKNFIKETLNKLRLDTKKEVIDFIHEKTYETHLHELYEEEIEMYYYQFKQL